MNTTQLHPKVQGMRTQRTYCMVKPDGVSRGLVGDIIHRIEKTGLKIVAMKMVIPTEDIVRKHVPLENKEWVERVGNKGLSTFTELNLPSLEILGTEDPKVVGKVISEALVKFLCSGPVVCMVVEGINAIDMVRKLAGHTLPNKAELGTIRGDYSVDSPAIANVQGRPVHNLFHASETEEEATNEINLWFKKDEVVSYIRSGEDVMFDKTY